MLKSQRYDGSLRLGVFKHIWHVRIDILVDELVEENRRVSENAKMMPHWSECLAQKVVVFH